MGVNGGSGVCSLFCDPSTAGSCGAGYSCVTIAVALVPSAPTLHVCQASSTDAGPSTLGFDGGRGPGPSTDAGAILDGNIHLIFDGHLP